MRATSGFTAAVLAAAAALAVAGPAAARGPGDGMFPGMPGMIGMMGDGPSGEMLFTLFDTNGDGTITTEELTARRAEMVAGTDANKDGKLSAEELAAQDLKMMQVMANLRAARQVELLDVDGDGLLSVEELSVRPGPEMMFERIDLNGDGSVTREEVEQARARMGDWRDGPGDGPRGHRMRKWMDGDN